MKLFKTLSFIALGTALSTVALASPGKGNSGGNLGSSYPPGLSSRPHGLQKQNKTPKGWSKGNKTGWMKCQKGDNSCADWSKKHPEWNQNNPEWRKNHRTWENNYREWRQKNCSVINGKLICSN